MNTFDINDPKLTAFALGELDATEAAAMEAQLASDASMRAAVDAIRQTAQLVSAELAAEPMPALTAQQRQAIRQGPQAAPRTPLIFRARTLWLGAGLAAAACLTVAIVLNLNGGRDQASTFTKREAGQGDRTAAGEKELNRALRDDVAAAGGLGSDKSIETAGAGTSPNGSLARSASTADATVAHVTGVSVSPESGKPVSAGQAGEEGSGMRMKDPGLPGAPAMSAPQPQPPIRMEEPASPPAPRPGGNRLRAATNSAGGPAPDAAPAAPVWGVGESRANPTAAKPRGAVGGRIADELIVNGRKDQPNTENYNLIQDNPFVQPIGGNALSTFSIDVDTASYSNVRRMLNENRLPEKDAVRIEEMINYFKYDYDAPSGETPFSAAVEINAAPWNPEHRLVRIGLRGKDVRMDMRPATSLVFLLDVSGSMNAPNKLPLVKDSMRLLVDQLNGDDRLAIITYAGNAGLALDSTYVRGEEKQKIFQAINGLSAGGSTNGAGGITMAYENATQHFIKGGINRVILCTDGDFNVGVSIESELVRLIEEKRTTGVYLSVLGFGTGNLQDAKMEMLADHGNGNFAYIDSIDEGKKVLVDQLAGTLVTIAKDVKIQVEFNPAKVGNYRLIGYENRVLAAKDFNDDRKDAGEIGAGHTVTALYEIVPPGTELGEPAPAPIDELKYQKPASTQPAVASDELLTLKLRYKEPDGDESKLVEFPVKDQGAGLDKASSDFKFASAVAAFGMILRDSPHKGAATLPAVLDLAQSGWRVGQLDMRGEFIQLVEKAKAIADAKSSR